VSASSKKATESQEGAPAGYKILKEGQARILYKEVALETDENNQIKTQKGKRNANE
jgi:hypothetical protein